tara:strand:- start:98 stop:475 length:378 start_codon:yes stop_codon:yes gene_type:complete
MKDKPMLARALKELQARRSEEKIRRTFTAATPKGLEGKPWPPHYRDGRKQKAHDFDRPNYTQCAKACGVSVTHISKIMRGLKNPSAGLLEKIARHYDLGMEELWIELKARRPKAHAPYSEVKPTP